MECSLGISNFLEEISSLSHSIIFLYFFALITEEGQEMQVRSLGPEDNLDESMAIHSSIPAWRIPWTEEPGGLQSIGLQRVAHD